MHNTSCSANVRTVAPFPYALPLPFEPNSDARLYALSHCMSMARHDGCTVELLPREREGDGRFLQETLLINGRRCSFQNPANLITNKFARRPYTKVMVSYSTLCFVDYAVFLTTVESKPPRVFVVPKDTLLREYFTQPRQHAILWLPVELLPSYKKKYSRVPYWSYVRIWPKKVA